MDPKGYETKPWWPYVQNLQEQIDSGGSGGGGVASIVVTIDTQAGTATCNATTADILNAVKAPAMDLIAYDMDGVKLGYYPMRPCLLEGLTENNFREVSFYSMMIEMEGNDETPEEQSTLKLNYNTFDVIRANRQAKLNMGFGLWFDANESKLSSTAPAQTIFVSMPNLN